MPTLTAALWLVIFIQFLLFLDPTSAQPDPVKWGKFADEELAMVSYPADSLAQAVILADYGSLAVDRISGKVRLERHERVKLLTEDGYEHGTVYINFYPSYEKISGIKGQTVVRDSKGKMVKHKLDKKDIFEEKVTDELRRIRFTLPGLAPGAIIEYRYDYTSEYPHILPKWFFQLGEPTIWSEFRAVIPQEYQYVMATTGSANWDVEEMTEGVNARGKTNVYRWVLKDVPALREEPFMTSPNDYRMAIQLQLSAYYSPGIGYVPFDNTWDRLAESMQGSPKWKDYEDPDGTVKRVVEPLLSGITDSAEKLSVLQRYVRTSFSWDGTHTYFPGQSPDDLLKSRRGTAAEINLMLICMARAAGLQADPVLISTRSHGRVQVSYPLLTQFNYVIARIQAGDQMHMVDATDRFHPYTTLPLRALVDHGWIVQTGRPVWVAVRAGDSAERTVRVEAGISEQGLLSGTVEVVGSGYNAIAIRTSLDDKSPNEFVRESVIDPQDADVSACDVNDVDSASSTIVIDCDFSVPAYGQVSGDFIYLNPMLAERWNENLLKRPERRFPVDFGYVRKNTYEFALTIPDGFELIEAPPNIHFNSESGGTRFSRNTKTQPEEIVFKTHVDVLRTEFKPNHYTHLRKFFERVVNEHSTQLVLRRKQVSAPDADSADRQS
jgi:transglutaminase-like putative cysteine protease